MGAHSSSVKSAASCRFLANQPGAAAHCDSAATCPLVFRLTVETVNRCAFSRCQHRHDRQEAAGEQILRNLRPGAEAFQRRGGKGFRHRQAGILAENQAGLDDRLQPLAAAVPRQTEVSFLHCRDGGRVRKGCTDAEISLPMLSILHLHPCFG